ncbi:DNA/RNA nuclease SfsA [Pannus brasiliensis CCIBt3594]|uniref:Sugar fermentation stimulation protein homolog n=1 Tax=Pannus brasiliensis CCIBt3594 TaxID=1427578 RepID=A0AAW9QYK2_9CHRO
MNRELVHSYPPLVKGILIKRYKRFFADIELADGSIVTAHCPNTGPMTGVCVEGSPVYLSASDNPKRKLAFTWEMIRLGETWVGVNTNLPNQAIKNALVRGLFPDLVGETTVVRSEVAYGQNNGSRVDFLLTRGDDRPTYIEVKNTTWTRGEIALFPDTVTTRGQKHLIELTDLLPNAEPVMLYFINRGDCTSFAPGDSKDPRYGQLFRRAVEKGVKVLPCRFEVTPSGIYYLGLAELLLQEPGV